MAGTILISKTSGVWLKSSQFDYIIEKIRQCFDDGQHDFRRQIYEPVDDGAMSFISLKEQSGDGLKAFLGAALRASENDLRDDPGSANKSTWDELIETLRADCRA